MKAKMNNFQCWINSSDERFLENTFEKILIKSNFSILGKVKHYFKPYGFTCLWLLGESHFAIHTFPEKNKTYIELSSCVDKPFNLFNKIFKNELANDKNSFIIDVIRLN